MVITVLDILLLVGKAASGASDATTTGIMLWILSGLVAVFLPMLAYFLIREHSRTGTALENISKSMGELNENLKKLELKVHEKFVTKNTFMDLSKEIKDVQKELRNLGRGGA